MNADVTITISTAAGGTVDTARPVPALGGDASVTEAAGHASGPVPLPLDQLPTRIRRRVHYRSGGSRRVAGPHAVGVAGDGRREHQRRCWGADADGPGPDDRRAGRSVGWCRWAPDAARGRGHGRGGICGHLEGSISPANVEPEGRPAADGPPGLAGSPGWWVGTKKRASKDEPRRRRAGKPCWRSAEGARSR